VFTKTYCRGITLSRTREITGICWEFGFHVLGEFGLFRNRLRSHMHKISFELFAAGAPVHPRHDNIFKVLVPCVAQLARGLSPFSGIVRRRRAVVKRRVARKRQRAELPQAGERLRRVGAASCFVVRWQWSAFLRCEAIPTGARTYFQRPQRFVTRAAGTTVGLCVL